MHHPEAIVQDHPVEVIVQVHLQAEVIVLREEVVTLAHHAAHLLVQDQADQVVQALLAAHEGGKGTVI